MSQAEKIAAPRAPAFPALRPGATLAVAAALAASVAMSWAQTKDVWTTGAFGDTDDAMRMVEVRDLVAGQSWFDMVAHRMDPPDGVFMHWSRTVDAPLALLLKFFGLLAPASSAEALTRLAFPLLLLAALYLVALRVAGLVGDRAAQILAIGVVFATGPALGQFVPGRIDHHAPQIVLLMLAAGATLAAFEAGRARSAWLAAGCVALSLSISLENLPFIAALVAAPAVAWIGRGEPQAPALRAFALGLLVALPLCFLATVGPLRWTNTACDAYSAAHLVSGTVGAAALLGLVSITSRLPSPASRAIAAAAAASLPLVALKLVAPQCLGDPFVGIDPLVRALWLDRVAEVQKLNDLAASQPSTAIMVGAPLAVAAAATLAAAGLSRGLARARLLLLASLIGIGFAMTFWGVRVFSSAAPLAAIGGACAATIFARRAPAGAGRTALAILLALPCAPLAYAVFLPPDPPGAASRTAACLRPAALRPLDAAPTGLVLAPIDEGSHLLAFTRHSVVAAPYHRDNAGNRLSLDVFMAAPDQAAALARKSGADYLVACPLMKRMEIMAERAPGGLAAALLAGRAPPWLEPIGIAAGPNLIYRIRR